MFRVILYAQWKWSKLLLLLGAVGAFALPILTVQETHVLDQTPWDASYVLNAVERWGVWYAALSAALGLLLATSCWASDHRGGHVYALTLPVERWRYVLLRFGAGALLLAVPIMLLWIGALLATGALELPDGLRAYPTAVALRFGLAAYVAYAVFFAISSGTARTAGYVLVGIGGLLAAQLLLGAAGVQQEILPWVFERLTWFGPFGVFTGRWALVDV